MSVFKTDPVAGIKKRAAASMNVFTKTLHDLQLINDDAEEIKKAKQDEIAALKSDIETVDKTIMGNHKVITKIEDFLA